MERGDREARWAWRGRRQQESEGTTSEGCGGRGGSGSYAAEVIRASGAVQHFETTPRFSLSLCFLPTKSVCLRTISAFPVFT
jgi:hypothetical protein